MTGESPLRMMRADSQRIPGRASRGGAPRKRVTLRRLFAAVAVVVVLGAGWCGLWYYAASVADRTLAGWVAREAAAGRVYSCGSQQISGFPFTIRVRCKEAAAAIKDTQPPFAVAAKEITFTARVYHPTLLIGEVTAPLTIAEPGGAAGFAATWSLAQMTVSGLPPDPDSISITIVAPQLDRSAGGGAATLFKAQNAELNARIIGGSASNRPVIDTVLHLTSATAPTVHPALAAPLRADAEIIIRGLQDLAPKPLAERFREIAASGGSIDIKLLRIERADAIMVASGKLAVNAHGKLDGTLALAISGLETIVPQLGIDRLIAQGVDSLTGASARSGEQQGLAALDRLMPGLSGVVRQSTNATLVEDFKKMGQATAIDSKPATALPLRFADGAVYLGIIRIGEVPALF